MLPYVVVFVWAALVAGLFGTRYGSVSDRDGRWLSGTVITLGFVASAPLVFLLAFRFEVGTDYASYVEIYQAYLDGDGPGKSYEPLYALLNRSATPLGDWGIVLVFGVAAALAMVPVMWRVMKSSHVPWLSVVVLFGMAYPFLASNTVRSVIAVSVLFFLLPAVWHKKPKIWIAGSLFSAGFHYTALLMIPFYWILRKNWSAVTACTLLLLAALLSTQKGMAHMFLEAIPSILPKNYAHYPGLVLERLSDYRFGFGYVWYIFSSLFVLVFWRRVGKLGLAETVIRNAFFLGIVIMIGFYQFWTVNRIGWFFWISGALYWPLVTYRLFGRGRLLFFGGLVLIHMLLFVQALWVGSHDAIPYQSISH